MLDDHRPWEPPPHPCNEASAEAVAVLLAMADWKGPIKHSELVALTNLDSQAVTYALRGLKERGRTAVEGRGPAATWYLAHRRSADAKAQGAA
jgi:hypothetical protein